MKANEAPEKIYISTMPNPSDGYVGIAWDEPHRTMVEYTRTDAFIEKAIGWLKKSITNNPETNRIISLNGIVTMGMLIDDFKNYMKGE